MNLVALHPSPHSSVPCRAYLFSSECSRHCCLVFSKGKGTLDLLTDKAPCCLQPFPPRNLATMLVAPLNPMVIDSYLVLLTTFQKLSSRGTYLYPPNFSYSSWYSGHYVHLTVPIPRGCSLRDNAVPMTPCTCSVLPSHACAHWYAVLTCSLGSQLPCVVKVII